MSTLTRKVIPIRDLYIGNFRIYIYITVTFMFHITIIIITFLGVYIYIYIEREREREREKERLNISVWENEVNVKTYSCTVYNWRPWWLNLLWHKITPKGLTCRKTKIQATIPFVFCQFMSFFKDELKDELIWNFSSFLFPNNCPVGGAHSTYPQQSDKTPLPQKEVSWVLH